MAKVLINNYKGTALKEQVTLPDGRHLLPYLPDKQLMEAVNLSIMLGKPLLIKGEPGCGKTKLATAVAFELFKKQLTNGELHLGDVLFEWHVKSSSNARDGLYRYDYVERLQHTQLRQFDPTAPLKSEFDYVKKGPLGQAFEQTNQLNKSVVVLIDEIDKADANFPNDLLRELDELRYTIEEIQDPSLREQAANFQHKPIVFITSNDEKELPLAFLRRCLFYHISFPTESELIKIVSAHFKERNQKQPIIKKVVEDFVKIRNEMNAQKDEREKKISTSELIDWCEILLRHEEQDILDLLKGELPYSTILFKNKDDQRFLNAHLKS
ncbi:MAG: MoxR family ATPase [Bacteroidota bacterium]